MNINPFDLIKNAGKLQEEAKKLQQDLEMITEEGTSGGGIVKIVLNGQFQIQSVTIDPIAVDPRDVAMLQDLIKAAHIDAMDKIRAAIAEKTKSLTGGLNIPDLFNGN